MAATRNPMCRAYCTAKCPRPPIPCTATRSPARAREVRSALKVVRPAQTIGAASTDLSSSGTAERPEAAAYNHLGVPTVIRGPREMLMEAVDEVAATALRALPAVSSEVADTDALADLPVRHPRSEGVNESDRFMSGNAWKFSVGR